jgi:16S rRNA (cytosine1402-N4)-methyltransferase
MRIKQKQTIHQPVLLEAVVSALSPQPGESYLDVTAGYGGHAREIIADLGQKGSATLVDRDPEAIETLQEVFEHNRNVIVVHDSFASATKRFVAEKQQFDVILADFGVSSPHLDKAPRGFSYRLDGPLDMRMNQQTGETAAELIERTSAEELTKILRRFGEEPRAKKIAASLKRKLPTTTQETRALIEEIVPPHQLNKTMARTFQALRIATNDELEQISQFLVKLPQLLKPGGRVVCISFHSSEDRMVKDRFRELAIMDGFTLATKKPISGENEDFNPRARSAKLRAAAKQK